MTVDLPDGETAIGYVTAEPDPAIPLDTITIPERHRLHTMVVGSTGYGKSSILKLLIRQNLLRGEGVAVMDPHHDLAAWVAQRIPRWRANHLVYISPAQLLRTHKAVPINPLEAYGGAPGTAATAFAETLLKAFGTKGVRMEQLLIQAATSLIASGRGGLGMLRQIIIDKSVRDTVLANVHIRDNLDFWERVFPTTAKEAVPAVDNKLTPIISNPGVGPFFEGDTIFDMKKLVDGNGILVFDGAGTSSDTERMIFTTFLLNMIVTAASKLAQSRPQGVRPVPFYVYVDEAQKLESDKLKEMLQEVRKWGIRMTLATQQLESMDAGNAAAMVGNCDLYLVSRCTPNTAKMLSSKMGADPDELTKIPRYHMAYHMGIPSGDIHGSMVRTRHMDQGPVSWECLEDVVDHSLGNYGVDVDMAKYTNRPECEYDVSPLQMAVLSVLYHTPDGLPAEHIHESTARFAADKRGIVRLLLQMIRSGLLEAVEGRSTTYRLLPHAITKYFDVAALKGRAGGQLHIDTLAALQDHYSRRGYYTRMDVGDTTAAMPDLEVCEPAVGPEGAPDPGRWGRRVAIEVETGPARHPNRPGKPGQVYRNYAKSRNAMTVWYMVYAESDMRVVRSQLADMGVPDDSYHISVVSADGIKGGTAVPLPPGFTPQDPLPHCEPPHPLDDMICGLVPKEGMRPGDLRRAVGESHPDREIALAVDRLVGCGRLRREIVKRKDMIFGVEG